MAILSIGELLGMGPSELSGLMPYSALEYSGAAITGISGSALGGQGGTDSATVSAIASSYAESAASSRVYQSAFDDCCSAVNSSISAISAAVSGVTGQTGNYIDWSSSGAFQPSGNYQPSGDYAFNSSLSGKLDTSASSSWYPMEGNPSGFLTEHQSLSGYATEGYVDSSVSGKLDASAVNFDGDSSHVTGISGVPLSAQGGAGDYVEKSSVNVVIGSSNTASSTAFAQGYANSASTKSFAQGNVNTASGSSFAQGFSNTASNVSLAQGKYNSAFGMSFTQGDVNYASSNSFAQGRGNRASKYSLAQGYYNSASYNSFAQGQYNSAINTAAVFGLYNLSGDGDTETGNSAAFAIGDGTAWNARHDLMLVTKDGEITMYSSTADTVGTGIMSSLRAISAAATGGGVDSATVSAIASSYAESAASSKLDISSVNFNGDSSYVTGISGVPLSATCPEPPTIPLTSTDGSVVITNQGTYADVIVTGTTGDFTVSGVSVLDLYRWATSQGYQP